MKKKFLVLISCLICCMLFVVGCGFTPLKGGPDMSANVYGNGGTVVRKGEYLYFANAYKTQADVKTNENKYGNETLSAIYRTKLTDNGVVEFDEEGLPVGAEVLVKQIAGFENSGLYIFGEYLYYTTPYTLKNDDGSDLTGLLRFCRVKLDGSNWKVLYETKQTSDTANYTLNQVDGLVYITIFDGKQIISVKVDGGRISSKVMVNEATSVVTYERADISKEDTLCEFDRYAYYTRAAKKDLDNKDTGTVVARIKFTDHNAKEERLYLGNNAYSVYEVKNNRLYMMLNSNICSVKADKTFEDADVFQYSYNTLGDKFIVVEDLNDAQTTFYGVIYENREDQGVITVYDNIILNLKGLGSHEEVYNGKADGVTLTLLYVEDGYVYYTEGGETVYRRSIATKGEAEVVATNFNLKTGDKEYFDYEGDYLFYFDTVTEKDENNSYLYLAKTVNGYTDDNDKKIGKYIGVVVEEVKTEDNSNGSDASAALPNK